MSLENTLPVKSPVSSDTNIKLQTIFFSPKNSTYILQHVYTKLTNDFPPQIVQPILLKYKNYLIDLQGTIYKSCFDDILRDLQSSGKLSLEEFLVSLNTITINKFYETLQNEILQTPSPKSPRVTFEKTSDDKSPSGSELENQDNLDVNSNNDIESNNNITNKITTKTTSTNTTNTQQDNTNILHTHNYQFFSKDFEFANGRYKCEIPLEYIHGGGGIEENQIILDQFCLQCDIYNITQTNNKLYLYEAGNRIIINIPLGYYTIHQLLNVLQTTFNQCSLNGHTYTICLDKIKNKTIIKSDTMLTFDFQFEDTFESSINSIQSILGFNKVHYMNNNIYISETQPIHNIYDNIYVKLFINEKHLERVTTSHDDFAYFCKIDTDYDKNFGKTVCRNPDSKFYHNGIDISNDSKCNTITLTIELWNSPITRIFKSCNFDFTMKFITHSIN